MSYTLKRKAVTTPKLPLPPPLQAHKRSRSLSESYRLPSALEAVLQPAQHNYLYFVADPRKPGYHIYAATLAEQEKNAAVYRQWLNERNIK